MPDPLFRDPAFRKALSVSTLFGGGQKRNEKDDASTEALEKVLLEASRVLDAAKYPSEEKGGVLRIVRAMRDRLLSLQDEHIVYWSTLDEHPPVFTWMEFRSFFIAWRASPDAATLERLVAEDAQRKEASVTAAYKELFVTALDSWHQEIRRAADDALTVAEINAAIAEAMHALALIRTARSPSYSTVTWLLLSGRSQSTSPCWRTRVKRFKMR